MLDRETSLLLEKIVASCGEGGYKIIDETDLCACVPEGSDVKELLGFLQDNRYVDVRYAEDGVYCLRPMPEGKMYFERAREEREEHRRRRRDIALFSALGAFAGGLLGALAAMLIAFAI